MANEELLLVKEAAQRLRLSPKTLYRMIDEGKLPAVRVTTRALRVPAKDVEKIRANMSGEFEPDSLLSRLS